MFRHTVAKLTILVTTLLSIYKPLASAFISSPSHLQHETSAAFHFLASSRRLSLPTQNGCSRFTSTTSKPNSSPLSFLVGRRDPTKIMIVSSLSPQEIIESCVSIDTFAPQFLWLLIIAAPSSKLTKKVMGPITPILALAAVHLLTVLLAASQEGALSQVLVFKEVFDPSLSQLAGMQKMFTFPNFVAEEWPHVLIWDLFVGRAIWLDGLQRDIDTRVALAFCNFIGPPGLLIHVGNCLLSGKGLPPLGYAEEDEDDN